jgi:hypothetical protein
MVFVTFNTSRGKPKPVTIQALLDSGASASLIHKKFARKLKLKMSKSSTTWTTTAGDLTMNSKCKSQFCIPELEDKILLEYDLNIANTLVGYSAAKYLRSLVKLVKPHPEIHPALCECFSTNPNRS